MSDSVHDERAREHLEALGLSASGGELASVLDTAAREERAPARVLDQLLTSERTARFERRMNANLKLSGIPSRKTLDAFDYDAQPGVTRGVAGSNPVPPTTSGTQEAPVGKPGGAASGEPLRALPVLVGVAVLETA